VPKKGGWSLKKEVVVVQKRGARTASGSLQSIDYMPLLFFCNFFIFFTFIFLEV
jgi:hypothetical protein